MRRCLAAATALVVIGFGADGAQAQTADDYRERARRLYGQGEYAAAANAYRHGHEMAPAIDDYYQIGICLRDARDPSEASWYLKRCLADPDCLREFGDQARLALSRLPSAQPEPSGAADAARPAPGGTQAPQRRAPMARRLWTWVAAGVAVAAGAGAVWAASRSWAAHDSALDPGRGCQSIAACDAARAHVANLNAAVYGFTAVAVLSAAGAVVLFVNEPRWSATPSGDGVGAVVSRRWRF